MWLEGHVTTKLPRRIMQLCGAAGEVVPAPLVLHVVEHHVQKARKLLVQGPCLLGQQVLARWPPLDGHVYLHPKRPDASHHLSLIHISEPTRPY